MEEMCSNHVYGKDLCIVDKFAAVKARLFIGGYVSK